MSGHQRIEERSLRLHRAVAEKLNHDSAILERARERVERWRLDGSVHPRYAEAWHRVLALEREEISRHLVDPEEKMCALRQCSPFAGALDPRERWRILRDGKRAGE